MSTQSYRVPLPCRYFHTAQGCPYGRACKYDHYSNNPSYFDYIKQKLHQMSKPKNNSTNNNDLINIMIQSMEQCITQIMNKQFHGLYQEINSLKNTINSQNKLLQNKNLSKHTDSSLTKQLNKITKLLKQQHSTKTPQKNKKTKPSFSNLELDNICKKLKSQFKALESDKKQCNKQLLTSLPSLPPTPTKKPTKKPKRARSRSPSPFDDVSQYENIFEIESEQKEDNKVNSVTVDQIVALPIPPQTKPVKKTELQIIPKPTLCMDIIEDIHTSEDDIDDTLPSPPAKPVKLDKKTNGNSNVVMKSKKKKKVKVKRGGNNKHYHHKKKQQKQSRSKHKRKCKGNKCNKKEKDLEDVVLPVLSYMNDTDWYQIIKSDSSDDDRNLTKEDSEKLDMLDSI